MDNHILNLTKVYLLIVGITALNYAMLTLFKNIYTVATHNCKKFNRHALAAEFAHLTSKKKFEENRSGQLG